MLVAVCLKAAIRTDVPLRLDAGGHAIRAEDAVPAAEETGRLALRTALALKREGAASRVLAVAAGPPAWDALLREALALGADEALRLWPDAPHGEAVDGSGAATRHVAGVVAAAVATRKPGLVLAGERSGDTGHECFGAFLAAGLGAAFAHRAVALEAEGEAWRVRVKIEHGYTQEMTLPAPAVVTLAIRLPEPAYPSLPAWLAALAAPVPHLACPAPPAPPAATVLRPPVPRVKRYTVPDAGLDAEGRIRAMVALPASQGGVLLGPELGVEAQAAEAARLLREGGYL